MTFNHFWEGAQPWTRNNGKIEINIRVGHFRVPGILHWDDPPSRRQIMNYLEFVCHLFLGFNLPKQGQASNQKKVSWVRYGILLRHLDLDHVGCPNVVPFF